MASTVSLEKLEITVSMIVLSLNYTDFQIPVHNAEEFLDACFEGINNQTYKGQIEVLLTE